MNKTHTNVRLLVLAALLSAIGIAIPMYSPLKIIIGPASFTLASHVPVFIAMVLSPTVGVAVALVSTLGFFLGGFPLVIVLRALTHIVFAGIGGMFLRKFPKTFLKPVSRISFSAVLAAAHGLMEVGVVIPFFYSNSLSEASYTSGFFVTVVLLVGLGSALHSMVDLEIASWLWKSTSPMLNLQPTQKA